MQIRITNLTTGGYFYTGLASSFNTATLPVPGFYRIEAINLPPYSQSYTNYVTLTYKFTYYNLAYNYYDDAGNNDHGL